MHKVDYRYCPMCRTKLIEKQAHNQRRKVCQGCGFIQFHDPKVAVIALVTRTFAENEQVLLIQRAIDPEKGKWALPGGHVDGGEMPKDALRRELLEEVGLPIQVEELLDIYPLLNPDGSNNGIVLAYRAIPASDAEGHGETQKAGADPSDRPLESNDDASDSGWFTVAEVPGELAFQSTQTLLDTWKSSVVAS